MNTTRTRATRPVKSPTAPILAAAVFSMVCLQLVVGGTDDTPPAAQGAPTTKPLAAPTTNPAKPAVFNGMTIEEAQTAADSLDPAHVPHTAVQDTKFKSVSLQAWTMDVYDESKPDAEIDRHFRMFVKAGTIDHSVITTTRTPRTAAATTGPSDGTDPAATGIPGAPGDATSGTGTANNTNNGTAPTNNNGTQTGTNTGNGTNTGTGTGTGTYTGGGRGGGGGGRGGGRR